MQRIFCRLSVLMVTLSLLIAGISWADRATPGEGAGRLSARQGLDDSGDDFGSMMYHMYGMMQHMRGMMHGMQEERGMHGHMGVEDDDDESPWGAMMGFGMGAGMHGMMGHHGRSHGRHMLRRLERLADELDLSDQQGRKIRALLRAHMKQAIQIRAQIAAQRIDLMERLDADSIDMEKVKSMLHEMASRKADLRFAHLSLMEEIKQQLTPEQQTKFRALHGHAWHGYGQKGGGKHGAFGRGYHDRQEMGHGRGMRPGMGMRNPCGMRQAPDKDR